VPRTPGRGPARTSSIRRTDSSAAGCGRSVRRTKGCSPPRRTAAKAPEPLGSARTRTRSPRVPDTAPGEGFRDDRSPLARLCSVHGSDPKSLVRGGRRRLLSGRCRLERYRTVALFLRGGLRRAALPGVRERIAGGDPLPGRSRGARRGFARGACRWNGRSRPCSTRDGVVHLLARGCGKASWSTDASPAPTGSGFEAIGIPLPEAPRRPVPHGPFWRPPTACCREPGLLDVFAVSGEGDLLQTRWDAEGFSACESLGGIGTPAGTPPCSAQSPPSMRARRAWVSSRAARSGDSRRQVVGTRNEWRTFVPLSSPDEVDPRDPALGLDCGRLPGRRPACGGGSTRADVFVRGPRGALFSAIWNGERWSPAASLGMPRAAPDAEPISVHRGPGGLRLEQVSRRRLRMRDRRKALSGLDDGRLVASSDAGHLRSAPRCAPLRLPRPLRVRAEVRRSSSSAIRSQSRHSLSRLNVGQGATPSFCARAKQGPASTGCMTRTADAAVFPANASDAGPGGCCNCRRPAWVRCGEAACPRRPS